VLAEEPSAAGGGDCRRRGYGGDEVAQAVDQAALDVGCVKEWAVADDICDACKQRVYLRGFFDVAAEEHGARRADQPQPCALSDIELGSGESYKE
jgi:hypothetical protein